MSLFRIILRNLRYYFREHLLLFAGLLTSTAILTAALLIGDSVDYSLKRIVSERLGKTQQVLLTQERFFPADLATKLTRELQIPTSAVLLLEGTALSEQRMATDVQICGIDEQFWTMGNAVQSLPEKNEVIVNDKLAAALGLQTGDELLIRLPKPGFVSNNTAFVPEDENILPVRMKIRAIAGADSFGNFSLRSRQISPYNVFFSLQDLSGLLFDGTFANLVLLAENNYTAEDIYRAVQKNWTLEDINLSLRSLDQQQKLELVSERIFMEDTILSVLGAAGLKPEPVFTYLVNRIDYQQGSTPYSFISGLESFPALTETPEPGEIILNTWLAEDLGATIGDSVQLEYYELESFRKLNTASSSFVVKSIVPVKGFARDSLLMPAFEGFSDVESCSSWEAGVPVDFSSIRPKDELWWTMYRGTPKAFIAYGEAQRLWGKEYGNTTAIRFELNTDPDNVRHILLSRLHPTSLGLNVRDVKKDSDWSAANAVDFAGLFLGLSFFLIMAAFLLSGLLFSMLLTQRSKEQGIYRSLGLSRSSISRIFLTEGMLNAILGSFTGVFGGIALSRLVLTFINSIWVDIVRTSSIELYVSPASLGLGFMANILVAVVVIVFLLRRHFGKQVYELQKNSLNLSTQRSNKKGKAWLITAICSGVLFLGLLLYAFIQDLYQQSQFHLSAGFLLLLSLNALLAFFLSKERSERSGAFSMKQLIYNNLRFNYRQHISISAILSIGLFIVLSTGANRTDVNRNAGQPESGTGGYTLFAQTSIGLNIDLSEPEGREKIGLSNDHPGLSMVQMLKFDGDDASCLNLNRIIRPAVLGLRTAPFLERNAFSFVKSVNNMTASWELLNQDLGERFVPAIADQTVITWGLGKAVGDTLIYLNEKGDSIGLILVAGLANSIFQGHLIISETQFRKHFPSNSGSRVLLADVEQTAENTFREQLEMALRSYGIHVENAAERLAAFNSVTNTYLDIFLALGGIALILGTLGIAIVLIRSIAARKQQFALMQAFGIRQQNIRRMLIAEYLLVLFAGVITGLTAAFAGSAPSLFGATAQVPLQTIIWILVLFLLNAFIWIYFAAALSLKKQFIQNLRNE